MKTTLIFEFFQNFYAFVIYTDPWIFRCTRTSLYVTSIKLFTILLIIIVKRVDKSQTNKEWHLSLFGYVYTKQGYNLLTRGYAHKWLRLLMVSIKQSRGAEIDSVISLCDSSKTVGNDSMMI